MRLSQCLIFLFLFCFSCEKYYLSVKREAVDRMKLASTFVGSPDPLQKNPPKGQELILEWRLPEEALQEELVLVLSVIYKNHTEEKICYPIDRRRGVVTYSVLGSDYKETDGFLTYKAEILNKDDSVIKQWKQQLWTDLIVID
ncbi:MAG: hypothetical protein KFB95_07125 [Simkaniaceae bacterium]|jgi:hypothetical protein|nr:MAG: hypothetical protein KFB95_07125 [Simkaniaceae bacterium]